MFRFTDSERDSLQYVISVLLGLYECSDEDKVIVVNFYNGLNKAELEIFNNLYDLFDDWQTYPIIYFNMFVDNELALLKDYLEFIDSNFVFENQSYELTNALEKIWEQL